MKELMLARTVYSVTKAVLLWHNIVRLDQCAGNPMGNIAREPCGVLWLAVL